MNEWAKLNAGEDIQSFMDFVKIYAYFRKAQGLFGVRNTRNASLKRSSGTNVGVWVESKNI